ncbi:NMDA receptor-regulated protein 1 [Massariosphaeria phaeospora]|uniref:NMDA receptor-regulated protein 1 n=1 Tax=Massariosphaeria phaeospora TaxID=100035 RepID=A0A7C8I3B4_9PLEO|nr:NMDA receptor-regulated protein 1 [Massariosphaeria phaeospora]
MQPLPSKENTLFKSLVKHYETKQYKKGLKAAEQILRKFPSHGDTQAMKALILNSQGHNDEAFALGKEALKHDMRSHVCWHVYGLLWRSVKNYEEAIKAYKFAIRIEPESQNIIRDLSLLQAQTRDFEGYIDSRRTMLQARPGLRQNWTALAVAHHLSGDCKEAERTLKAYEDTLKQPPPRTDLEHSEAVLYKNTIIYESGDVERALDHLEEIRKANLDPTAVMELKGQYLLDLKRNEEAEKVYRALLDRNSENRQYFSGLEKALGLSHTDEAAAEKLAELYQFYAAKNERNDATRRIPLDFLKGDAFKRAADNYLRKKLNKGVPSTFPNIKALYKDSEKRDTIEELVLGYASEHKTNGSAQGEVNGDKSDRFEQSVLSFLAQHYDYHASRDLEKATKYIDQLIELNPKSVDYNQLKARIWKHYGNTKKAAETLNHARELDERDRYINTKCAKYQVRNNEHELALKTMSKFTRNETVGGPLGDLHDMQCMWFLLEEGDSYLRQRNLGLALKRYTSVADIFETWWEDQLDFHSFSIRKGQIRAYIDMVRWEDHLREHPFFTRAALSAVNIYVQLADNPKLATEEGDDLSKMDPAERKKMQKKAKKEQEKAQKAEADKKAAAAAAKATPATEEATKKEDPDPNGFKLLETKEPLEAALRFLVPLLESSPKNIEAQNVGFEVYLRRKKYLLALKCLSSARALNKDQPKLHEQSIRFHQALKEASALPAHVAAILKDEFTSQWPGNADLTAHNEAFFRNFSTSPAHLQAGFYARYLLDPTDKTKAACEAELTKLLTADLDISIEQAVAGAAYLDRWNSDDKTKEAYREAAARKWPEATVFQTN